MQLRKELAEVEGRAESISQNLVALKEESTDSVKEGKKIVE
jgi:hypothetical protein